MKYLMKFEGLFSNLIYKDEKIGERMLKEFDSIQDIKKEMRFTYGFSYPMFTFNFNGKTYRIKNITTVAYKIETKIEFQHHSGVFLPSDMSQSLTNKIYNKLLNTSVSK